MGIEVFRLRIVSKRQITIPQRMLNVLRLAEGDELQIHVDTDASKIVLAEARTSIPTDLFTPEIEQELNTRENQMRDTQRRKVRASELKPTMKSVG